VNRAEERNRAPYSYQRVILRTYDVCKSAVVAPGASDDAAPVLSFEDRKHLRRWAEYAPTRLGLEKWAVKALGRERAMRRSEMYNVVLGLQHEMPCCDAEVIRAAAERVSRPGLLLARSIAEANYISESDSERVFGYC